MGDSRVLPAQYRSAIGQVCFADSDISVLDQ